ncbi:hypothetical protein C8J57DRAFT_1237008 [Mycena rebaudengoi]|nr:hypothetical protein C8J57DRAFT_1237008 [Mycena rebaudengoi]
MQSSPATHTTSGQRVSLYRLLGLSLGQYQITYYYLAVNLKSPEARNLPNAVLCIPSPHFSRAPFGRTTSESGPGNAVNANIDSAAFSHTSGHASAQIANIRKFEKVTGSLNNMSGEATNEGSTGDDEPNPWIVIFSSKSREKKGAMFLAMRTRGVEPHQLLPKDKRRCQQRRCTLHHVLVISFQSRLDE